jgi:hypothetical protein
MFVGYSKDHDSDFYDMWYPKNSKVYVTRDVIWLNWMFYIAEVTEGVDLPDELDDEIEGINVPAEDDEIEGINVPAEDDESLERNEEKTGVQTTESNNYSGGATRAGARYKELAPANLIINPVELTDAEVKYMSYMKTCVCRRWPWLWI